MKHLPLILIAVPPPGEWSGSCDPCDPANYWVDDETGERVSAATGQRSKHKCLLLDDRGCVIEEGE